MLLRAVSSLGATAVSGWIVGRGGRAALCGVGGPAASVAWARQMPAARTPLSTPSDDNQKCLCFANCPLAKLSPWRRTSGLRDLFTQMFLQENVIRNVIGSTNVCFPYRFGSRTGRMPSIFGTGVKFLMCSWFQRGARGSSAGRPRWPSISPRGAFPFSRGRLKVPLFLIPRTPSGTLPVTGDRCS